LQPIGSFKIRGAGNAIESIELNQLKSAGGVVTASAGNMAQGVAWNASRLGLPCGVVVPDHAPQAKLDAIERFGAKIVKIPFDKWWDILVSHKCPIDGYFIHPVCHPDVIAGNGTVGLEIIEQLHDVDVVIVPYGGGALSVGIASACKAINPNIKVYAAEVETSAALRAAFLAGDVKPIEYQKSWVDGIGSGSVLHEMWPLVRSIIDGSIVVTLAETASSVKLLIERNRIVAEGAGASSVAAALRFSRLGDEAVTINTHLKTTIKLPEKDLKIVAVISGIDSEKIIECLRSKL